MDIEESKAKSNRSNLEIVYPYGENSSMGGGRDGDSDGSNFLGKGGGGINTLQIRLDQLLGSWWQPLCQARYHKTEAIFNNDRR